MIVFEAFIVAAQCCSVQINFFEGEVSAPRHILTLRSQSKPANWGTPPNAMQDIADLLHDYVAGADRASSLISLQFKTNASFIDKSSNHVSKHWIGFGMRL